MLANSVSAEAFLSAATFLMYPHLAESNLSGISSYKDTDRIRGGLHLHDLI
jgi:hypothetical protein